MIDATTEITDIKAELQAYSVYKNHYVDDTAFIAGLTRFCGEAMREEMLYYMDSSVYESLQTEGKAGLLASYETTLYYAYWAEVYFTVAYFYRYHDRLDKAARQGYTETQGAVGGGSRMISGFSGKDAASAEYITRAERCMSQAGFDTQKKMKVRGSIHA
jgi:hypothetical protein